MMDPLQYVNMVDYRDIPLSVFRNVKTNTPQATTLGRWLQSCKEPTGLQQGYADTVTRLRATEDEAQQKALKLSLPAVTVGAMLHSRQKSLSDAEKIACITGFTQVDIDMKDNPHLNDAAALRDAVARIAYVAFAGLSASGRGVWALVKVAEPENIGAHFEQLCRDFGAYSIKLDRSKGRNPTDLRIYSYDPDAVIKERFAVYARKFTPTERHKPSRPLRYDPLPVASIFKGAETFATKKAGAFTVRQGNRHHYIANLCFYLNRQGIPQREAEAYINSHLMPLSEIKSNCITSAYMDCVNDFGAWQTDTNTNYSPSAPPIVKISTVKSVAPIALVSNSESSPPLLGWDAINTPEPWEINPF